MDVKLDEINLSELDIDQVSEQLYQLSVTIGTRLIAAILVLVVGLWIINRVSSFFKGIMQKREMDESLIPFLKGIINITLKVVLAITVIGVLGIETTSFIAVLGSAGLAIGLALQGSLANFAGGVIILTLKPFFKGEFIEGAGQSGTVQSINILNTELKTPNGQIVYVPNSQLASTSIINYSREENRRLVITYGISYGDDIKKAKEIIQGVLQKAEGILEDPAPVIGVSDLGDSSVDIEIKIWVPRAVYWDLFYSLREEVKYALEAGGCIIPFPQRDVHLYKHER